MLLAVILSTLFTVQAGVIPDNECDGIVINDIYHDIEILKTDLDRPYFLAVEQSTDTLYFSYSINPKDETFVSARLNLETKDFQNITGVPDGFAQTVDPKTQEVYIGGSDGIYKYDAKTNEAVFYAAKGKDIWTLYFKDVIYYSDFPQQILYTVSEGETVRFKDLEDTKVDNFVIDKDDNMFYTNGTGLYGQKKGSKDAVLYKKIETSGISGLTTDKEGNVYVCNVDGIYVVNKKEVSFDKVVEIDDCFGIAFDSNNNIVYADSTQLVRLKANKDKICDNN